MMKMSFFLIIVITSLKDNEESLIHEVY